MQILSYRPLPPFLLVQERGAKEARSLKRREGLGCAGLRAGDATFALWQSDPLPCPSPPIPFRQLALTDRRFFSPHPGVRRGRGYHSKNDNLLPGSLLRWIAINTVANPTEIP